MAVAVRGTQSLVEQMGWVFKRPSLTALEVAWRWLFGIPVLIACWVEAQRILALVPIDSTGLADANIQNPWLASVQVADAWVQYRPHVMAVLPLIAAPAAVAWVVFSGIGRNLVLKRMNPKLPFRPIAQILLQAAWLAALIAIGWAWFRSIGWAAATHIGSNAEPDLVGYFIWVIFLSLGFFTLWALVSWIVSIAPLLVLLEERSALSALGESLSLGKAFTGKLVEINLVMGIVKLCLIVLAMVFSSVFLPFSQEVGAGALHLDWIVVSIACCVASDYFQVVRLKSFVEFWKTFRV
ncbi:MAG: hypothetical protein WBE76_06910 [Terracidiphilus sp.]